MVQISHVYKTYGSDRHVLKNVQLTIEKGDFTFVMGPSGAGKTTLFRMITGFESPTSGSIHVNGYQLEKMVNKQIPYFRRTIGVVFQDFRLLNDRTVFENIALPMQILGQHKWKIDQEVSDILEKVDLTKRRSEYPSYLSGGEKQRVAIARALVHRPSLLIADEPTGNLDKKLSREIMALFEQANIRGTTVIIATHDDSLVAKKKNKRVLNLENGQLVEIGEEKKWRPFYKPLNEAGLSIL